MRRRRGADRESARFRVHSQLLAGIQRVTLKSATRLIGALLVTFVCLGMAYAQNYPDRPIRLIVPFGAGGITDQTARIVAQELSKQLGQTVVVENRPGAGGAVAAGQVAKAASDGYTLMIMTNGMVAVNPLILGQLSYDPLNDFEYISMIANTHAGVCDIVR
jgi:tripartite-type tricarboxylate transporter receptor subunit TctC